MVDWFNEAQRIFMNVEGIKISKSLFIIKSYPWCLYKVKNAVNDSMGRDGSERAKQYCIELQVIFHDIHTVYL